MGYWKYHGVLFLLGLVVFPRLTLLCFAATPFGVVAWLGWFLWPSLLVAVLATQQFVDTNPFLVAVAWLVVLVKLVSLGSTREKPAPTPRPHGL